MDRIAEALSHLDQRRRALASRTVRYVHYGIGIDIDATPARSELAGLGLGDAIIETFQRDYIVATEDLTINGVAFTPEPGDVIEDQDERYEVLPDRSAAWRPCEPTGSLLRIHTRRVL